MISSTTLCCVAWQLPTGKARGHHPAVFLTKVRLSVRNQRLPQAAQLLVVCAFHGGQQLDKFFVRFSSMAGTFSTKSALHSSVAIVQLLCYMGCFGMGVSLGLTVLKDLRHIKVRPAQGIDLHQCVAQRKKAPTSGAAKRACGVFAKVWRARLAAAIAAAAPPRHPRACDKAWAPPAALAAPAGWRTSNTCCASKTSPRGAGSTKVARLRRQPTLSRVLLNTWLSSSSDRLSTGTDRPCTSGGNSRRAAPTTPHARSWLKCSRNRCCTICAGCRLQRAWA